MRCGGAGASSSACGASIDHAHTSLARKIIMSCAARAGVAVEAVFSAEVLGSRPCPQRASPARGRQCVAPLTPPGLPHEVPDNPRPVLRYSHTPHGNALEARSSAEMAVMPQSRSCASHSDATRSTAYRRNSRHASRAALASAGSAVLMRRYQCAGRARGDGVWVCSLRGESQRRERGQMRGERVQDALRSDSWLELRETESAM
ncbi:hypothetical protein FA95DRAFT_559382 [Auriscalpium vulgare]|uniref:Uncharacterized protein n=1 Tax=Auriscalpium vulgare TaxID=40419 RepID=A0ACB8RE99_9AGAM|nr:hypothetical protein FA95DRAFT_559382 [Auriscalpium vulgare]